MEFGKNFIQAAFKKFEKTGTAGSFKRWCKRHGHKGVTIGCINEGRRNRNLKIRRKAIFAQNIHPNRFGEEPVKKGCGCGFGTVKNDIAFLKGLKSI